jgi:hypothetical protein
MAGITRQTYHVHLYDLSDSLLFAPKMRDSLVLNVHSSTGKSLPRPDLVPFSRRGTKYFKVGMFHTEIAMIGLMRESKSSGCTSHQRIVLKRVEYWMCL